MERYLLFAYDTYYPSGGTNDLVGDFATPEEALDAYQDTIDDHGHILDTLTGQIEYI